MPGFSKDPQPLGANLALLQTRIDKILASHPPDPDARDLHALACSDGWVFTDEGNTVRPCRQCRSVGHFIRDIYS